MHGLRQPEQAKQIKERHSYCLKQQLSPGKVPFSCQLSAKRSAQYQVPKQVAQTYVRTPFYREHDVTPMVLR